MTLLLPLIFMVVLIGAVLFGCYLLRAILPREHSLQPRLTDEAISNYAGHAAKNAKASWHASSFCISRSLCSSIRSSRQGRTVGAGKPTMNRVETRIGAPLWQSSAGRRPFVPPDSTPRNTQR